MKKAGVIVAVILVLAGIGAIKNKTDAKKAEETRVAVTATAAPSATPKPTVKPTPTPELQLLEPELAAAEPAVKRSVERTYVINTNTGKFHYPSCSSVSKMKDYNKMEFTGAREDIVAMGYQPCGKCNP